MAKPMVITNREEGEVCIVELNGEIDANTAPSISSEVLDLTKTKSKILIEDKIPVIKFNIISILNFFCLNFMKQ